MTDYTTKVNLVAVVSGYVAGMRQATRETLTLGSAAQKLAAQRSGFDAVGRSMLAVGALAAAGVGLAVKSFAEFDAKMSQVQSLSHATSEEMDQLSDAALTLGRNIGISANEVADAEIELVKAGISVGDIMGGALAGALRLAAAGQIDVAQATEIATIAMTQFGLKGAQIPHVADLLSAGADKALGGVGDLGEALKSGGLIAAQFGISLDETVGTLSAFANAGLIGETAGTDLRQMLLKLAAPAADAQKVMDDLGISIYGASGQFVGIANLSGQLYDKLHTLTPETRNAALATLFGARAIAGANVLYKEGAEGIKGWTVAVNDSGFAAKQAAGKMDNLKGDVSKLEAAFNTGLIESGSSANDILRVMTQTLTGLVSGFADLPQPVLAVTLGLGAIIAIIGVVGGTALIAVPRIAAFKDGLTALGLNGRSVAGGLGAVGGALALATFLLGAFAAKQAESKASTQEFADSLDQTTGAVTGYTHELAAKKLQEQGAFESAAKAGISQRELTNAVITGGAALEAVVKKLHDYADSQFVTGQRSGFLGSEQGKLAGKITEVSGELEGGRDALENTNAATKDLAGSTTVAADAYQEAADKAATLQSNLTSLIDTINKANGVGQDAVSANASYRQAIDEATTAIDEFVEANSQSSDNINEQTAAGSKNAAMFADIAKKSQDAAKAQFDLDGNLQNYKATLDNGRQSMYDQIVALTGSADAAQALTDKIYAIPSTAQFQVIADTNDAQRRLDAINSSLDAFRSSGLSVAAYVRSVDGNENGGLYADGVKAFENGGFPSGIYPGRPGGIHKFAEGNLPWETYISPKPGQRTRNLSIWEETGRRLGVQSVVSPGGSGTTNTSSTKVELNAHGVDPVTVTNLLYQRFNASMATR